MNEPQIWSCSFLNGMLVNLPFLPVRSHDDEPFWSHHLWTWTLGPWTFGNTKSSSHVWLFFEHSQSPNHAQAVVWRLNVWWAIWVSRRRCHMAYLQLMGGLIACAAFEFWGWLFPVLKTSRAMENHHVSKGDISSNGCVFHSHVTFWGGWRVYMFYF